ncbi:hypothetical protein M5K25_003282 [Dendrobium thyrsiflorum]|uniref:ABC transporter domain-containing protein n=1 Tax=Dendrobium thyrsiflorum TaxID=117978 RepID=A0ABD0VK82_DENTH
MIIRMTLLLGPPGSGKTALLKTLSGKLQSDLKYQVREGNWSDDRVHNEDAVKKWWIWDYWISPFMYSQNAISINEFQGRKWSQIIPGSNQTLGFSILKSRGIFQDEKWYWIGASALFGYVLLFNFLYTISLSYFKQKVRDSTVRIGMVLPFIPLYKTFDNLRYSVDMPKEKKTRDKLVLLDGVSGYFRPGVLTALMGVSGAGKTTLMDVSGAGRKTRGYLEGNITISGYPKKKETFARMKNKAIIAELSIPPPGSDDLHFSTQYPQMFHTQCIACLWKQHLSYWRNPPYTALRFLFTILIALLFGTIFWDLGSKKSKQQDLINAMGSMYCAVLFLGVFHSNGVQPTVAIERKRMPTWCKWYYWACPLAWTLYGLISSQYGDDNNLLDMKETVAEFVKSYFGYRHDYLGVVADDICILSLI